MKKLLLILLLNLLVFNSVVFAKEVESFETDPVRLGARYEINNEQVLNLRVTKVPKKYPWIEKDDKGKTINPDYGSIIVAENVHALKLKDKNGDSYTIPAGSKFFARVGETVPAKSFWRKEKVKLDFYALAISDGSFDEYFEETSFQNYDGKTINQPKVLSSSIQLSKDLHYDSKKDENFKDILGHVAMLGGYTVGGALAGPLMLFSISSLVGAVTTVSAFSNPYVVGGAAAIGGAVGLASGIMRKGGSLRIEPGEKIKITLDNGWAITKLLDKDLKNKSPLVAEKINDKFILDILKVKSKHDTFGDKALQLIIYYKNKTEQDITYTSFKLVDSTGKAYEANADDLSFDFYDGLPKEGTMRLSFTVDYPNAAHQLKVVDRITRKTLAYKQVVLD